MPAVQMIVTMDEQGQIQVQGPGDFASMFLLIEAAREITMRRFMPEKPASQILVPNLVINGARQ